MTGLINLTRAWRTSHHPMTGKDSSRLGIQRCRSEPCIDRGVLDIGMSQPIFHERQISASVEEMRCDRMLQAMELAFLLRNPRSLSVLLHQLPEHEPANRHIAIRHKEIRRLIRTSSQI